MSPPTISRTLTDADVEAIAQRVVSLLNGVCRTAIDAGAVYTVPQAARLVNLHAVTLREKLRDGVVEGRRQHGGRWRIKGSELLKLA